MIPVSSSNISAVSYDEQQQTFQVKFKTDAIYQHDGVPPEVYKAFMDAPSKGKFYADRIKRTYPFRKL